MTVKHNQEPPTFNYHSTIKNHQQSTSNHTFNHHQPSPACLCEFQPSLSWAAPILQPSLTESLLAAFPSLDGPRWRTCSPPRGRWRLWSMITIMMIKTMTMVVIALKILILRCMPSWRSPASRRESSGLSLVNFSCTTRSWSLTLSLEDGTL